MRLTCLCNIIHSKTKYKIRAFWVDWMKFNHEKTHLKIVTCFEFCYFFKPNYVQHQPLSVSNAFYHVLIYVHSICLDLHLSEQFCLSFPCPLLIIYSDSLLLCLMCVNDPFFATEVIYLSQIWRYQMFVYRVIELPEVLSLNLIRETACI